MFDCIDASIDVGETTRNEDRGCPDFGTDYSPDQAELTELLAAGAHVVVRDVRTDCGPTVVTVTRIALTADGRRCAYGNADEAALVRQLLTAIAGTSATYRVMANRTRLPALRMAA